MKTDEVKIGNTYRCKVTGKLADVRITGESRYGGWDGVNVATNRKVRIKSPQRLRAVAQHASVGKRKKIVSLAEYEAQAKDSIPPADVGPGAKKHAKATGKPKTAKQRPTGEPGATQRGLSGLDAAAQVLAEAGTPLNAKAMVAQMLAKNLWKTSGKTPAATIYAAIIREIAAKGDKSRFRKTERGKFELIK